MICRPTQRLTGIAALTGMGKKGKTFFLSFVSKFLERKWKHGISINFKSKSSNPTQLKDGNESL